MITFCERRQVRSRVRRKEKMRAFNATVCFLAICISVGAINDSGHNGKRLRNTSTHEAIGTSKGRDLRKSMKKGTQTPEGPKDATSFTKQANDKVYKDLPFENDEDFKIASANLIRSADVVEVKDADMNTVWNLTDFKFINETAAPGTANPSLWRQGQLLLKHGLFKVVDGIYQVRGYDLSVMSIIRGKTGWIVIDPLMTNEPAIAAMDLIKAEFGDIPIKAIIYTHSHVDHFGGVEGVISNEDLENGVQVIAPRHFMEEAVSENTLAGNAMSRRATYHVGTLLPRNANGHIGSGLGLSGSTGKTSLILPTEEIEEDFATRYLDGIKIEFLNTPGAEAPSEFVFYIPEMKALCVSEEANASLHNLYTLRGAKVRNGKVWAQWLNKMIDLWGDDMEVAFGSHHWPRFGKADATKWLEKQADAYKYIHDQTLRLANNGYKPVEIANMIKLPDQLDKQWYNRGYYGSVKHNIRAQYQLYLGWFDANPANLDPLPPVEESKKMVEALGGPEQVIKKAEIANKNGDYRWGARLLNYLVFADPENMKARNLQADILEQLGYQAESGTWRGFYLSAAKELREGVTPSQVTDSTVIADPEALFDVMSVRLNGSGAVKKDITLNVKFMGSTFPSHQVIVRNGVLNFYKFDGDEHHPNADATITTLFHDIVDLAINPENIDDFLEKAHVEGDVRVVRFLFKNIEVPKFWFNIVTPNMY